MANTDINSLLYTGTDSLGKSITATQADIDSGAVLKNGYKLNGVMNSDGSAWSGDSNGGLGSIMNNIGLDGKGGFMGASKEQLGALGSGFEIGKGLFDISNSLNATKMAKKLANKQMEVMDFNMNNTRNEIARVNKARDNLNSSYNS